MPFRRIPVPLTDDEAKEYGQKLGALVVDLERLKDEQKAAHTEEREARDALQAQIASLAQILQEGKEEREVDVTEEHDHQTLMVHVKSAAGELILSRAMTQLEMDAARSPGLPFTDGVPENGNGAGASLTGPLEGADLIEDAGQRYPAKAKKRSERGKRLRKPNPGAEEPAAAALAR